MVIRHAEPLRDAAGCLEIYGPFAANTAISFEDKEPSLTDFEHRIERIGRTHAFLVADDLGEIAGFAYAGSHRERPAYRWAAEVSVYLGERYRGQGLARALYEPLFALLEEQGYRILLAAITVPNSASVTLHESLGFEQIGLFKRIGWKAGAWRDVLWLGRQLGSGGYEEHSPPSPGAPVRLAQPIDL